jgi:hypothetical protein
VRLAEQELVVEAWADPSNPENWLQRPAKRQCFHCGQTYTSRIMLLAAKPFCSEECSRAAWQKLQDLAR